MEDFFAALSRVLYFRIGVLVFGRKKMKDGNLTRVQRIILGAGAIAIPTATLLFALWGLYRFDLLPTWRLGVTGNG